MAPLSDHFQLDFEIRSGNVRCCASRPFDKADALSCEIFVKAGFKILIRMGEPIKIKVI